MAVTTTTREKYGDAVAAEVRAWLGRRGWRQRELADRMGADEMWVSRKLRGKSRISLDELPAFARALGCDLGDLLPRLDSNQQPFGLLSSQVSEGDDVAVAA